MPRYKIAHIDGQGVDLIIIPLDATFGALTAFEQQEKIAELQLRVRNAGLPGTVVPIWKENGRIVFIAPRSWHHFFTNLPSDFVETNLNKELFW